MHPLLTSEHMKLILEHISDGIQVIDQEGMLIYCNRNSAMLDDINLSESIGRHITEVYPSLKEQESTLLKVLENKTPILNREQTYRTYRGKKITTINSTLPILVAGQIAGAIEISRDITPYKELSERYMDLQSTLHTNESALKPEYGRAEYHFEDIITVHAEFNRIKTIAMKAARTEIPILVYGETGTGKELLTQAIHNSSKRHLRPFVAQNCAALPSSLLEGILFGTVKGGFTGAVDRMGLFELADRGTLFLDEINSMPQDLQAKLLRVLQDGKIRRIGDTKERKVDVRIIAATNVEPNKAIDMGLIRRDLYYRLNTVTLWIPKLSDRREDIPVLTNYFIEKYNNALYRNIKGLSKQVSDLFMSYEWEGNVRELEHIIESAVNFTEGQWIEVEDLPPTLRRNLPQKSQVPPVLSEDCETDLVKRLLAYEKKAIEEALEAEEYNISKAAKTLKIPRQTLQYKMKKFDIDPSR